MNEECAGIGAWTFFIGGAVTIIAAAFTGARIFKVRRALQDLISSAARLVRGLLVKVLCARNSIDIFYFLLTTSLQRGFSAEGTLPQPAMTTTPENEHSCSFWAAVVFSVCHLS